MEGEDPKAFLRNRRRRHDIKADPSHPGWFDIPVFYGDHIRVNMFKPSKAGSGKEELKDRLRLLLRTRTGYRPGDEFYSVWGRFVVDDRLGISEF